MKYLKEFENEADVKMGVLPNVVLANDTNKVLYNVEPIFVYIQHIDGRLIKPAQWEAEGIASSEANGVAVVTDEAAFVVAKSRITSAFWSTNQSTLIDGILTTTDAAIAVTDYAGKSNTELATKSDKYGAFSSVAQWSMPNGQSCYIPALGELNTALRFSEEIDNAMSIIGGTPLNFSGNTYWSSTQNSAERAWIVQYGNISYMSKGVSISVRPFAPLE